MKIAICFYGLHPDECWKTYSIKEDKCYDYWINNVINKNDCDIFIHSFSKKNKELLKYKPKSYLFEDVEYFKNNIIDKQNKNYNRHPNIPLITIVSYGVKKTCNLMLDYSKKHNIEYDLILISRMDVCWLNPIIFNNLNVNYFYSAIWGKNNYYTNKSDGFLAYWFISNKKNIIEFSKIFDNIYKYIEKYNSWHFITKIHADSFLNESDIKYICNDIDNNNIDMDLQRYLSSKNII